MSFSRWIYWSAIFGAWSALVGWLFAEILLGRWVHQSLFAAIAMSCLVSMAIGGGLAAASNLGQGHWTNTVIRALPGLAGGFLAGLIGSTFGNLFFFLLGPRFIVLDTMGRIIGWALMGVCLGLVQGVFERSTRKLINGLIGGAVGGALAGLLFNPIGTLVGSPMSSRAFGFVILGLCIGLMIGCVQVMLKDAWITVEQGFRPGRQLLLGQPVVTMGTSERAGLIFIAYGAKGVEPIHLEIVRVGDTGYEVRDAGSRTGTFVNDTRLTAPARLRDGDLIRLGPNEVRFHQGVRSGEVRSGEVRSGEVRSGRRPRPVAQRTPEPLAAVTLTPLPDTHPAVVTVSAPAKQRAPAAPAKQQPPPAPTASAAAAPCPVCNQVNKGLVGDRRCTGCFAVY